MNSHFALSWIYDELHVCRLQHDTVTELWTAPEPVRDLGDLHRALVACSERLGLHRGGTLAIACQSDRLVHRILELPPLNTRDMERHLARRVEQENSDGGDFAYSYRRLNSERYGSGALLHLLPRTELDAIIRIAGENHLTPQALLPINDILLHHVASLDLAESEIVLAVALFPNRVELVASTGHGEGLFVRSLQFDWSGDRCERLRLDIERTLLYLKQRQQIVERIVIAGAGAPHACELLHPHFSQPITQLPQGSEPWFWARAVGTMPAATSGNLVPLHVRNSLRTIRILHGSSWIAAAAVVAALAIGISVEYLRWQQRDTDPGWSERYAELRQQRDAYARRAANLNELQQQLAGLTPAQGDVPAQFLARLGEIVPASAAVQRAEVAWERDHWRIRIEGETRAKMADAITVLESIEQSIEAAPWHGQVFDSWRGDWLERLRQGGATDSGPIGFRVEGSL